MGIIDKFSQNPLARRFALPLLRMVAFDFSMRHPWVDGQRIRLNSFKHKGYWFFRRSRELNSMKLFGKLIGPGSTVVEVGGHIGFITTYFANLVGNTGSVIVFEPGLNNLPYIRNNLTKITKSSSFGCVSLIEMAVGDHCGSISFFEDDLTGQNNSVVENFDGLEGNAKMAFTKLNVSRRDVTMTTLDEHLKNNPVSFVKIDVEGHELSVLKGMMEIMRTQQPMIMVEVQTSRTEIMRCLSEFGYMIFNDSGCRVEDVDRLEANMFALHTQRHADIINRHFS